MPSMSPSTSHHHSSYYYYEESLVITTTTAAAAAAATRTSQSSPSPSTRTTRRQEQQQCDGCYYGVQIESVQRSWRNGDLPPRTCQPEWSLPPPPPRRTVVSSDSDGSAGDSDDSIRGVADVDNDDDLSLARLPLRQEPGNDILRVVQRLLKRHKATRISIQYRNQAASSSTTRTASAASSDRSTIGGPSGMSVQVDFLRQTESERSMVGRHNDDDDDDDANSNKREMLHILGELHDRRILVAPIVGAGDGAGGGRGGSASAGDDDPTFRHTSRLHPRPFLVTTTASGGNITRNSVSVVTYTYNLPTDGSMASSEGLESFLQLLPCGNDAGLWSVASNEDWSHVLLGTAVDSTRRRTSGDGGDDDDNPVMMYPLASHMPRRLWIEAKLDPAPSTDVDDVDDGSSMITATCPTEFNSSSFEWTGVSLSHGIEYTLMKPNNNNNDNDGSALPSLRSLLPLSRQVGIDDRFTLCPLADATRLVAGASIVDIGNNESISLSVPLVELFHLGMERDRAAAKTIQKLDVPSGPSSAAWYLDYTVERTSGQAHRGTIRASLTSYHAKCPTIATLHHVLPQVLSPVWQSLRVELYNTTISSSTASHPTILQWKDLDWTGEVRMDDHDGTIRWSFRHMLPPNSTMVMILEYEASFLNFEEFPPDPNRGFELPPVVAQLSTPASCVDGSTGELNASEGRRTLFMTTTTLYSESPLLMSPVPDMSMPFNVISLTCTWYAFVIGSLIHLLLRKGSERIKYQLYPELRPKPPLQKIKDKFTAKWAQVRASKRAKPAATTTTEEENDDATSRSVSAATTPAEAKSQE